MFFRNKKVKDIFNHQKRVKKNNTEKYSQITNKTPDACQYWSLLRLDVYSLSCHMNVPFSYKANLPF